MGLAYQCLTHQISDGTAFVTTVVSQTSREWRGCLLGKFNEGYSTD